MHVQWHLADGNEMQSDDIRTWKEQEQQKALREK